MKFCSKCGSIMMPTKVDGESVFKCSCGNIESGEMKLKHENKQELKDVEVVEKDIETLPVIKNKCEKCGNEEAYYWEIQTRSPDEPPTRFYKCKKCKFTWREYS